MPDSPGTAHDTRLGHIKILVDALVDRIHGAGTPAALTIAADIKREVDSLSRPDTAPRRRWTDTPPECIHPFVSPND